MAFEGNIRASAEAALDKEKVKNIDDFARLAVAATAHEMSVLLTDNATEAAELETDIRMTLEKAVQERILDRAAQYGVGELWNGKGLEAALEADLKARDELKKLVSDASVALAPSLPKIFQSARITATTHDLEKAHMGHVLADVERLAPQPAPWSTEEWQQVAQESPQQLVSALIEAKLVDEDDRSRKGIESIPRGTDAHSDADKAVKSGLLVANLGWKIVRLLRAREVSDPSMVSKKKAPNLGTFSEMISGMYEDALANGASSINALRRAVYEAAKDMEQFPNMVKAAN